MGFETRLTGIVQVLTRRVKGEIKDTQRYTYDNNGNITAVRNGSATEYHVKYTYDGINQLIREDNAVLDKSWTFSYDTAGNILSKKEYAYTTGTLGSVLDTKTYTYAGTGWKDRLISWDGEAIEYDAMGNPTTYLGHALTWGKIRQLESYRIDSNTLLTYEYGNGGVCGFQYDNVKYYLNSRYYDPWTCRFIGADILLDARAFPGYNLFAYCLNNPELYADPSGKFVLTILGVTLTAKAVATILTGIFVVTATVVVLSPDFQENWNTMCDEIAGTISNGLRDLGDKIGQSLGWIKSKAKSIAQSIGDSFVKVKEKPRYKTDYELHHLVAKMARNAGYARTILRSVGIGVNDKENLQLIKTGLHRRLHTDTYYGWSNSVVISAYESANGNSDLQKSNVLSALETIRAFVLMLDKRAPF